MIHTSIEIAASPERVREIFLDFAAYSTWHTSFIQSISSKDPSKPLEKGDTVFGTMAGVAFTAKILENTRQSLSWEGPPWTGIFVGEHVFRFNPSTITKGGTTFVQEETYRGIMAWTLNPSLPLGKTMQGHFEKFNADLKVEAEKDMVVEKTFI